MLEKEREIETVKLVDDAHSLGLYPPGYPDVDCGIAVAWAPTERDSRVAMDEEHYRQVLERVEAMSMEERDRYVRETLGNEPPDNKPGWHVIVDYPPEANGQERLVWKRSIHSVVQPAACKDSDEQKAE